jgi:HD-like signal output (HDOD) protein
MPSLDQEFDRILAQVERVRTSAGVAHRVLRLIDDPDFETQQVVALLETDTALATQILQLVNSSYFGLPRQVASLRQAVICLGPRTLRLALLNYGVLQCLATGLPPDLREELLRHSLTAALVAETLLKRRDAEHADEAYCAGLIMDVGILAMLQAKLPNYRELLLDLRLAPKLAGAERDAYGFDHAQLGARLLTHWNLPPGIIDAVARHHEPPRRTDADLRTAVQVAALVAEALWLPQSPRVDEARRLLGEHYDYNIDAFIDLAVMCKEWLSEHATILNLHLRSEINIDQLRQRAMERFVAESVATAVECDGITSLLDQPPHHFA